MKRILLCLLFLLSALIPAPVQATRHCGPEPLPMYSQSTLRYWQGRYTTTLNQLLTIFTDGAQSASGVRTYYLTAASRRALEGVVLDIPLSVSEDATSQFTYFADVANRTVTMSAQSLKFLDDLALAYAWLHVNGHDIAPVFDYVAMLTYRPYSSFDDCRLPPPLEALAIPDDAQENPDVEELGVRLFVNARGFILLHELGHIRFNHKGYVPGQRRTATKTEQAIAEEAEADRFALEGMAATGDIPGGVPLLMLAFAQSEPNRWRFKTEAEWQDFLSTQKTHPLSHERVKALAEGLSELTVSFARKQPNYQLGREMIEEIAAEMQRLAAKLADREIQQSIPITAAATTLASLQKHVQKEPITDSDAPPFAGTYTGLFGQHNREGTDELPVTVAFTRSRNSVVGVFDFGYGAGSINGTVTGDTLAFQWSWSLWRGWGEMKTNRTGDEVTGTWGLGNNSSGGGTWQLARPASASQAQATRAPTLTPTPTPDPTSRIQATLQDQHLLVTGRQGGLTGWHYFRDIYFCDGYYLLFGRNWKMTILDNEVDIRWSERGIWEVGQSGRQAYFRLQPLRSTDTSRLNQVYDFAVDVSASGRISVPGYTVAERNRANCP